jgi:hypothetical protein
MPKDEDATRDTPLTPARDRPDDLGGAEDPDAPGLEPGQRGELSDLDDLYDRLEPTAESPWTPPLLRYPSEPSVRSLRRAIFGAVIVGVVAFLIVGFSMAHLAPFFFASPGYP